MMPMARNNLSNALCAVTLGLLLAAGGCAQVAGVVANSQGPQDVQAEYVPKKVATLVLAEADPRGTADDLSARDIGRRVEAEWTVHKLSLLVDSNAVESLRTKMGAQYHHMSISDVGRALGAKQVLYISVNSASAEPTADVLRGNVVVHAKIVEVSSGDSLWPSSTTVGEQVDAQSEYVNKGDGIDESTVLNETRLVLATDLVKKFYKWNPETASR